MLPTVIRGDDGTPPSRLASATTHATVVQANGKCFLDARPAYVVRQKDDVDQPKLWQSYVERR
jgi:hypothetical protein